jgi:BON domain-containing protein
VTTNVSVTTTSPADRDVERRVVLFLEQQRLTRGARLSVIASRGVVTLRGTAATFHQRQLLVSAARRVAGAVQVIDEFEVDPPRPANQPSRPTEQNLAVLASTVALIAGLMLAGCGRVGPPRVPTHPTKGSVTYQGQPISGAFLALHPRNGAPADVPTSTAVVQPDGTFAVTTYDASDGVPEGEYVVTIQWRKATKSGGEYLPGPNLLPVKYSRPETSDVVVRVAAGQNELPPIALKR